MPETSTQTPMQDTLIDAPNIKLHPLPMGGKRWDYFQRKKQVRAVCQKVSPSYDVLLVRGITPRQWVVWQGCRVKLKAFLLVGSLLENRPPVGVSLSKFLTWALNQLRLQEFKLIGQDGILFANSPELTREIRAVCGKHAQFIPTNTLSQTQFPPLNLRKINNPIQLVFCGRVVQEKGIEELIHALGLLKKQASCCQLSIVGKVQSAYRLHLEELAQQVGVTTYISWLGFVPFSEKLLALYQAADFLVLPSYHEGFPHCIWEAGANSLPVVCTKVGGIPGLVDETMVSFVEKRSALAIASTILALQQNDSGRWQKVESLHRYSQQFVVEATARQLCNALKPAELSN